MVAGTSPDARRAGRLGFKRAFTPIKRRAYRADSRAPRSQQLLFGGPLTAIVSNGEAVHAKPSTAASYTTAYPGQQPLSRHAGTENAAPAPTVVETTKAGRLPRSRTFNALASITQSFSRASLASRATSRNVSGSSTTTTRTEHSAGPLSGRLTSTERKASDKPAILSSVTECGVRAPLAAPTQDPRLIATAQPSAYWAGRFMALHDRFHSEILDQDNLDTLIRDHLRQMGFVGGEKKENKTGLPASATTAKLQQLGNPNAGISKTELTISQIRPSATSGSIAQGPHGPTPWRSIGTYDVSLFGDENQRCRRVFIHLEAMCTTAEARRSLHAWQKLYARRTGRESLLPEGRSMDDNRGFVARLLSGSRLALGVGGGAER